MQNKQIDFAIITIRVDEYEAIAKRFQPTPQRGASGRTYGISNIQTKDGKRCTVAVARCADPGPQAAQQIASDIINDLSPLLLLVVGIAGAIPDTDFTLGDVIVSSRIHDFGVNAFKQDEIQWDARGGIHALVSEIVASLPMYNSWLDGWNSPDSINIPRPIIDTTKFKSFDIAQLTDKDKQSIFDGNPPESWQKKILSALDWSFNNPPQRPNQPLYSIGNIASSGSLVRDTSILIQWLKNARGIRAIEMEAGGVFQAAQQLLERDYPVMAIRGISDIVGLERNYRWTPYACHSAAAFTYALLTANSQIFDNLQRQRSATSTSNQPQTSGEPSPSSNHKNPGAQVSTPPIKAQEGGKDAAIQVYMSYAEEDEALKKELEKHLTLLKRQGIINTWHNRQIGLGLEEDKEVDSHIDTAQIILLLVSMNFLASNYCYEQEMTRALQRQASGEARIIPILLRSAADWKSAPFGKLQGLPRNGKPVASSRDHDEVWSEIAREIRSLCKELRGETA